MDQCPKCQSTNTRFLSVIHDEGTSQITTKSGSSCLGTVGCYYFCGCVPALFYSMFGGKKQTGTVQSNKAQKSAPPESAMGGLILVGILTLFGLGYLPGFLIMLPIFIAVLWYQLKVYPRQLEIWRHSVMCDRCGAIFTVDGFVPPEEADFQEEAKKLADSAAPMMKKAKEKASPLLEKGLQAGGNLAAQARDRIEGATATAGPRRPAWEEDTTDATGPLTHPRLEPLKLSVEQGERLLGRHAAGNLPSDGEEIAAARGLLTRLSADIEVLLAFVQEHIKTMPKGDAEAVRRLAPINSTLNAALGVQKRLKEVLDDLGSAENKYGRGS